MANLKGSTYEKQIRDLNFKLFALGEKKTGDHLTHSNATLEKRNMYANDFANFLEANNIEGKLNQLLTPETMNTFLQERLDGLALSTQENYITGFNSLLKGLNEANISHNVGENYFKNKWEEIKHSTPKIPKEARGIQFPDVVEQLTQIRHESGVLASLMVEHGYRINEALNIANNPQKYISPLGNGDYKISGIAGKGGKIYQDKIITRAEYKNLSSLEKVPSKSTFSRDLKKIAPSLRAHDFRYEFARNTFKKEIEVSGYRRALETVSKALNHHRREISLYYLKE